MAGSMWQLLMGLRQCGLKNDALMETFYDVVMENYYMDSCIGSTFPFLMNKGT